MIVGQGLKLTLIGVLVGFLGAIAVAHLLKAMLFEVTMWDAFTFGAIGLLVICLAILASYIPGGRATRIDPLTAMKHE
jgi:putative ABC transport system permease protein